eukprot:COSAG04_NODE_66_length_29513_cov_208.948732_3_plen_54_part_00
MFDRQRLGWGGRGGGGTGVTGDGGFDEQGKILVHLLCAGIERGIQRSGLVHEG